MASDQMLPNSSVSSKKQQQLEAGRRKLEEFRKKKEAAKRAASSNSVNGGNLHEIRPPVSDSTSDLSPQNLGNNESESQPIHHTNANPSTSSNKPSANPDKKLDHGVDIEKSRPFHHPEEDNHSSFNHYSNNIKLGDAFRDENLKDFTSTNSFTAQVSVNKFSPEASSSANNSSQNHQPANGSTYRDSIFEVGKSVQGVFEHHYQPATESSFESVISSTSRYDSVPVSVSGPTTGLPARRSRPSFLDSILPNEETDKANNTLSSKIHPVDASSSSSSSSVTQNFIKSSSSVGNVGGGGGGGDRFGQGGVVDMERNSNYSSTKQNEDFAALEQHIEDLTQEKFSLQRALEASRVLAESLATENSALTDTYNQQGGVVNQLKLDMERLQEEIKAQLVELEAMRTEYGNAMLECSAADERAKLLASEVIGLEEKALRLRSNELKLERQMENLEAEMASQKRRISSLEKDRQDLQSTIEALQEEKKLLQSKLRKAPAITNSADIKKHTTNRKEVSTSTEDLDESEDTTTTTTTSAAATSNLAEMAGGGESDGSSQSRQLGFEASSSSIPPDQIRMIHNITTLISELALEKQELVQALSTESSRSSKLRDLNKELSQRLEAQTQRLELLTSQSMLSDNNVPSRKAAPPPRTVVESTPYADEGDEVVERVLGWIMKLFPGGPSRRQTKHL